VGGEKRTSAGPREPALSPSARGDSLRRLVSWVELQRDGTRLACCDYGGEGPAVLFLHGAAGHAGDWAATAAGVVGDHRVLALDQRGHGRSERRPDDVSREAYVADVAHVIDELDLAPVVLVGQSMGANTAFLAAAAYPERVSALVVVEASPDGPAPELRRRIQQWLDRWPIPFPSLQQTLRFSLSRSLKPDTWIAGNGPGVDSKVMIASIADLAARDYWAQWETIGCPTLIVRGEHGSFSAEHAEHLARALAHGEHATIPNAGHDLHRENPGEWLLTLQRFLAR
jgi:pimeloyl-ACP methyl ester carboxylesterase